MTRTYAVLAALILAVTGLVCTAGASAATAGAGKVVPYPLVNLDRYSNYTPAPTPTDGLAMTVGGTPVNIQDNRNSSQTRFAMAGPQRVVITVSGGVTSADIRPAAFGLAPTVAGDTITFTLDRPRDFAVDINGVTDRLLVFADPLEVNPPQPTDPDVANVLSFPGVTNDGTVCTAALQAALNYVSAHHAAKPILYFPDGVYRTALLNIPSNVQIYLHSGATILADPDITDYPKIAPDYADQANVSALLLIRNVSNVKIFGRGMLNGGGYNMYTSHGQALRLEILYTSQGANNLTFNDIMLTNSLFYQSHFQGSNRVSLTNIKFNNPEGGPVNNDDGFKVNASTNVSYNGGWISARDDTMTFAACCGATEAIKSTNNVTVSKVVLDGSATASADIRFAFTDYGHTVTGVTVSNIYDIGRGRGETFLVAPSGSDYTYRVDWGQITLHNWDIEENEPLVHFDISANDVPVTISNFTISNITMPDGTQDNFVQGGAGRIFDHVHFADVIVNGVRANWGTLQLRTNQYATDVTIDGTSQAQYQASLNLARTARATTTSIRANDTAAAANDGNLATYFQSATNPAFPQYLTYTWTTPQQVSALTYACDHCQSRGLTSWDIQTSVDGTTWTTVASSGTVTWSHDGSTPESRTVSFPAVHDARGIRLQITNANLSTGQYRINEVDVRAPTDLALTATASTTSIRAGDPAAAANDGDAATYFQSATNPTFPQYLTYTWTTPQQVDTLTYVCDRCQSRGLTSWDVQTSADGSTNWTTVASSGAVTWSHDDSARESRIVSFPTAYNVKGVRLQITNANLDTGQYRINEVTISGPANLAATATASTTSIRDGDSVATANDGDVFTFFKSAMHPTFPQYLTFTWTAPQQVSAVTYVCDFCQGQGLTNWDIQTSADGSTGWTTVASSGDVSWSFYNGTREDKVVSFSTVHDVKGVRLQINNAKLDFGQYQIDEVEIN